jgi:hypothetical protein
MRLVIEEDMWAPNNITKMCSASLVIWKMQIKTIAKYHSTPIRTVNIKKSDNTK